eukprot:5253121-Lingulodinium_polyedra.AAC.1
MHLVKREGGLNSFEDPAQDNKGDREPARQDCRKSKSNRAISDPQKSKCCFGAAWKQLGRCLGAARELLG